MFRIAKINGQWVLVSNDGQYIFVQIQYRDTVRSQHDKWAFVLLLENIQFENGTVSFIKKPKVFKTEEEGEQFVQDAFELFFLEE